MMKNASEISRFLLTSSSWKQFIIFRSTNSKILNEAVDEIQTDQKSKIKDEIAEFADEQLPIEKRSLTRGLCLDKFEKDFMIYPEYEQTSDFDAIKKYATQLEEDLRKAVKELRVTNAVASGSLPVPLIQALAKNDVASVFVPKKFGGSGFCEKDKLLVMEKLGADLSIFLSVNQLQIAASLITTLGTDEQKVKYLPKIGLSHSRPAICLHDESYGESAEMEVTDAKSVGMRINGIKTNVINATNANLFLVFAKHRVNDTVLRKCFIIDRTMLRDNESITIEDRMQTNGLNSCSFSSVRFDNVSVGPDAELGIGTNSNDLYSDLMVSEKAYFGAAVVGCLKQLINEMCNFANTRIDGNLRFSDSHPVQCAITKLSIELYALESMVYYQGGLVDEGLYLMHDIEASIIQRFALKVLREAILAVTDVAGIISSYKEFSFEKILRDIVTLTSIAEPDLKLVRNIVLPAIETHIEHNKGFINSLRQFTLIANILETNNAFNEPGLKHFIGEHVHPSLEPAARELEQSMSRLSKAFHKLTNDEGIFLKLDYLVLKDIAVVIENNFAMLASIARASRSYSVGLRNTEEELVWVMYYCTRAAKQSESILREILEVFALFRINPSLTKIGNSVLESSGYYIESPIEKNW